MKRNSITHNTSVNVPLLYLTQYVNSTMKRNSIIHNTSAANTTENSAVVRGGLGRSVVRANKEGRNMITGSH